jgi:hypothetical protein
MEIFEFAVSLRLWHPTITPDELSAELGMKPRVERIKSGANYWCSDSKKGKDSELILAIEEFLGLLEPHAIFLRRFVATGGRAEQFVGWFTSQRSGGESLPAELLSRLGALGLDLSLDVYAPDVSRDVDRTLLM